MLLNSNYEIACSNVLFAQLGSDTQHYCKAPGDIGLGLFLGEKNCYHFYLAGIV